MTCNKRISAIYQSIHKFLDKITTNIDEPDFYELITDALRQLKKQTEQATSLVGQDIIDYIKELENHAKKLKVYFAYKNNYYKYNKSQRDRFSEEYEKEVDWFHYYPYYSPLFIEKKFYEEVRFDDPGSDLP